jgi:hypothetical protein
MNREELKANVFDPVSAQIRKRASVLQHVRRFPHCGIEGWLKVEAVAALGDLVKAVNNKGPDLRLEGGDRIELKGATDFWLDNIEQGATRYGVPCLFLADGSQTARMDTLSDSESEVELVASTLFSDGKNQWVIGMIIPRM